MKRKLITWMDKISVHEDLLIVLFATVHVTIVVIVLSILTR